MTTPKSCCGKSGQGCVWYGTFLPSPLCRHSADSPNTAPRKRNARVERNRRCTAPAAKHPLRTQLLVLVAHAVRHCPRLLTSLRVRFLRNKADETKGARPAGACTCARAKTENSAPSGDTCLCGSRPAGTLHPSI